MKIAAFLLYPLLVPISMTIHDKTGYDALSSSPKDFAKKLQVPAIFLTAEKDNVSPSTKVQKMFNKYGSGKKKFHLMQGRDHADGRQEEELSIASGYLKQIYRSYLKEKKARNS